MIGPRVENLLELDYPQEQLELVVASDGSTDRTDEIVAAHDGARPPPRSASARGKLPSMNRAVRETESEIVAFGDANATWAPDALRKLVRSFADPDVAYVCGQVRFQRQDGTNKEGLYWRYELWLRESESRARLDHRRQRRDLRGPALGLRRVAVRARPRLPGPDGAARPPRRLRARGARVREALARHRGRVPPQGADAALVVAAPVRGRQPARRPAALPRGAALAPRPPLRERLPPPGAARDERRARAARGSCTRRRSPRRPAWLALAAAGKLRLKVPGAGIAYYYLLMSWATVVALGRYLREGAPLDVGESGGNSLAPAKQPQGRLACRSCASPRGQSARRVCRCSFSWRPAATSKHADPQLTEESGSGRPAPAEPIPKQAASPRTCACSCSTETSARRSGARSSASWAAPGEPTASADGADPAPAPGPAARHRGQARVRPLPPAAQLRQPPAATASASSSRSCSGRCTAPPRNGRRRIRTSASARRSGRSGAARLGALLEFPAVVDDGVAFVSNYKGSVRAYLMRNGATVWRRDIGGMMAASPAVFGGELVVHGMDGYVWVLNRYNGRVLWRYAAGSPIESSPVVVNGVDYFGDWGGTVSRARPAHAQGCAGRTAPATRSPRARRTRSGTVFIGDYGGRLLALAAGNGQLALVGAASTAGSTGHLRSRAAASSCPSSTGGSLTAFSTSGARLWSLRHGLVRLLVSGRLERPRLHRLLQRRLLLPLGEERRPRCGTSRPRGRSRGRRRSSTGSRTSATGSTGSTA